VDQKANKWLLGKNVGKVAAGKSNFQKRNMIILLNGTAVWVTQCAQQSDCWPIRQLFWLHFNPVAYLAKYGKVMKSTPSKKLLLLFLC
jgi:hypothetical protein